MLRDLKVVSPMALLYARDGVDVALIAVEVEPGAVTVRLAGLPGEERDKLEHSYVERVNAFKVERAAPAGKRVPRQPAESLFDVELSLSDDAETRYILKATSYGGSSSMFRSEWFFQPGPPPSASRLVVTGADASVEITL